MQRLSLFIFVLLTALAAYGFADDQNCFSGEESNLTCLEANRARPALDAKVGYFFFSDAKMRKIYDQAQLVVPLIGPTGIFHPLDKCHARRTT